MFKMDEEGNFLDEKDTLTLKRVVSFVLVVGFSKLEPC
jgi:hypothetical protein